MIVLKMQLMTIDEDIDPANLEKLKSFLENQRNKFYSKICKMGLNIDPKNISSNRTKIIYMPTNARNYRKLTQEHKDKISKSNKGKQRLS